MIKHEYPKAGQQQFFMILSAHANGKKSEYLVRSHTHAGVKM
ncbi:hypothetical protein PAUR_a0640 [Pseudoalteromonas aurantia 208]|uniref:Uncharacterized protein n=1 Tax=Pseudoalteromonas aurantia 208 TaxID=1314867 RepID=A0ABR9E8I4_9GAMM|nr:hypothetical protein [Pseudoalteromonas aurantia 208]